MAINNPAPGLPRGLVEKKLWRAVERACLTGGSMLINRIEVGFKGRFLGLLTSMVSSGGIGSDSKPSKNKVLVQWQECQIGSQDT